MAAKYDPKERHERYMRERELKGRRKRGAAELESSSAEYQVSSGNTRPLNALNETGRTVLKNAKAFLRDELKKIKEELKAEYDAAKEAATEKRDKAVEALKDKLESDIVQLQDLLKGKGLSSTQKAQLRSRIRSLRSAYKADKSALYETCKAEKAEAQANYKTGVEAEKEAMEQEYNDLYDKMVKDSKYKNPKYKKK